MYICHKISGNIQHSQLDRHPLSLLSREARKVLVLLRMKKARLVDSLLRKKDRSSHAKHSRSPKEELMEFGRDPTGIESYHSKRRFLKRGAVFHACEILRCSQMPVV